MYLHRREQQTKKGDLSASPLAAHVLISYLVRTQAAKKSGTASKIEFSPTAAQHTVVVTESWLTLSELPSRSGGNPHKIQVGCPQNGTAVLSGMSAKIQ